MLKTPLISLALTLAAGLFFTVSAEASPRFTIENNTNRTIKVYVYNGGDMECSTSAKTKRVGPNKKRIYGCTGNGLGKCKVQFYVDSRAICENEENTCGKTAIKMKRGANAKITENGQNFKCDIS